MTVLHIASPFAISSPVPESQSSSSAGDDRNGHSRDGAHVQTKAIAARSSAQQGNSLVDARDTRAVLMRTVDLAMPAIAASAVSASVNAVLAAYQQGTSVAEDGDGEPG